MKQRLALLRNVALVSVASYIEAAIGLLIGIVIARVLGPTEYGHYAFAIWLCGALIVASNNALTTSSIKFLAEARGAELEAVASALAWRLQRMQLASNALVLAVFTAFMFIEQPDEWEGMLVVFVPIAVVAVWARANFWMLGALGKGYERFEPENVALALTACANLGMVLALTLFKPTMVGYFAVYALAGVVANIVVRLGLRRYGIRPQRGPVPAQMEGRFRRHLVLTAVLILVGLAANRSVEMVLLKSFATSAEVGYFAIAGSLTKGAVDLLAGGMSAVLLPAMARAYGRGGQGELAGMFAESTRLYWFLGLAIAGLGITVTEGAVHLLYGARYEQAITAVTWNLIIAGIAVVYGASAAVLTAADRQDDRIRIVVCALVVNIAAGLLLIPKWGINGAIGSLAITQLFEVLYALYVARRRTGVALRWSLLGRTALAAVIATCAGAAVSRSVHLSVGFLIGAAVFVPTYLALSVWLRAWRGRDFELFAGLAEKLGRPGAALSHQVHRLKHRYAPAD